MWNFVNPIWKYSWYFCNLQHSKWLKLSVWMFLYCLKNIIMIYCAKNLVKVEIETCACFNHLYWHSCKWPFYKEIHHAMGLKLIFLAVKLAQSMWLASDNDKLISLKLQISPADILFLQIKLILSQDQKVLKQVNIFSWRYW